MKRNQPQLFLNFLFEQTGHNVSRNVLGFGFSWFCDSQSCNIPQNVLNFSLFWCAQSERFSESNSDHHSDSSVFLKSTSDPVGTFFAMFHRFSLVRSLLMFLLWSLLLSRTKFCRNQVFWFFKTKQHKAESVYHKRCERTMSLNLWIWLLTTGTYFMISNNLLIIENRLTFRGIHVAGSQYRLLFKSLMKFHNYFTSWILSPLTHRKLMASHPVI